MRLTRAPAVPSELTVSGDASGAFLVWSDSNDGAGGERADLHGLKVTTKAAAPEGKELRLSETPAHSFSPALCRRGDETVLAWLERAPAEGEQALMLGVLDARGSWKSSPERVVLARGTPAALDLDCTAEVERLAVLATVENQAELSVLERRRGRFGTQKTLARLPDGSATDQRPVLRGEELLFEEASPSGQHRIRRLKLGWE